MLLEEEEIMAEIKKEDEKHKHGYVHERKDYWKPIKIIGAIFLILMIVVGFYLVYFIKFDPSPGRIPTIDEVIPEDLSVKNITDRSLSGEGWNKFYYPNDPQIKMIANKIVSEACSGGPDVCNAKALYYFVRDNVNYVKDPVTFEHIETPEEVLITGLADCDGHAVLLANLLGAVGIQNGFETKPGHVYNTFFIPGYRGNKWIDIDATCKHCEFGEIPMFS